ncbi:hypothetical protein JSY14_06060 [Brachybacterium sp. EF45031]|uniref:arsenate reductase/protein-tyrosine-phosphatase family protein n=1 Tax=Brachybacterium sillae TaxID=2810536 RepID=UPI00217D3902|nr:hypothetical protein [Brachybacterium sillae]MCS6711611.1 hypothetical protein [Brachybacterium sillae]
MIAAPPPEDAPVQSVLFVCTANICRSAYAEILLQWLVPSLDVRSAGVYALRGTPMDEPMKGEVERRGIPAPDKRGHQLRPSDVAEADLILVMDENHREFLLQEYPRSLKKVGLLGAIDTLVPIVGTGDVLRTSHVAAWARQPARAEDAIEDPYRKPREVVERVAATLTQKVEVLADLIAPLEHSDLVGPDGRAL